MAIHSFQCPNPNCGKTKPISLLTSALALGYEQGPMTADERKANHILKPVPFECSDCGEKYVLEVKLIPKAQPVKVDPPKEEEPKKPVRKTTRKTTKK